MKFVNIICIAVMPSNKKMKDGQKNEAKRTKSAEKKKRAKQSNVQSKIPYVVF